EGATMPSAAEVIRLLDLKPHPEGGHFRETFRDLLSARARRALALAQGRCGRSLALPRRGTAQARDRGGREGTARVRDAGSGSYRRRAPAGDRAGSRLAGGAKPGRVDAGELHGGARIRFQVLRDCAEGLGAAGRLVTVPSGEVLAAVRRQRRTGDEAGLVGREKNDAARDLLRLAQAA